MKNSQVKFKTSFVDKKKLLIGIICIVFSLILATVYIVSELNISKNKYTVYMLKTNIQSGNIIGKEDIKKTYTNDSNIAELTLYKINDIVGKEAQRDLYKNNYIYADDIENEKNEVVPEGKQIISITISSSAAALSYQIKKGDIVRIFGFDGIKAYTPDSLKYVKVANIYDEYGKEIKKIDGTTLPKTISIYVSQLQAEKIISMEKSYIHCTLIHRGNTKNAEKALAEQEEINKETE